MNCSVPVSIKYTMAPKPKFADGEKVLCFHGPLMYEAKCLKSSITKEKHVRYLIHYAGWNKNWDEWVPESRVLKYNDANVQRQKEIQRVHSAQPTKTKKTQLKGRKSETFNLATPIKEESRSSTPSCKDSKEDLPLPRSGKISWASFGETSSSSSDQQPKKKRGRFDMTIESEEKYLNKVEVKIKMPEELKVWLVDDWDMITRQQRLAKLPAKITVKNVCENYLSFKKAGKSTNPSKESTLEDFTNGIQEYFNATLGSQLLYKFERMQYAEILQNYGPIPMSHVYGAIHLLRLFCKIGSMLAYTALSERYIQCLQANIQEFLKYMVANRATLFNLQDYKNATPDYHRKLQ